jgi:hypothetical protein
VVTSLDDIEIIGLQVVCAVRCGHLGAFSCNECEDHEKEEKNCLGVDSDTPVKYLEGVGEFYACPIQFVPQSVYSFLERYDYYEKYPSGAPSFEAVNPRYLEALKVYESTMQKLSAPQEKPKKDLHKSNVSRMNALIVKK